MTRQAEAFLGSGVTYPFQLKDGAAKIVSGRELVAADLHNLLSTIQGENYFLPERGSRLEELMFEPNDEVLATMARQFIFEAITTWEKRVKFVDAEFEFFTEVVAGDTSDENLGARVNITISFRILASNEVDSFVYPFYRQIKY